jgi:hypothetical protein
MKKENLSVGVRQALDMIRDEYGSLENYLLGFEKKELLQKYPKKVRKAYNTVEKDTEERILRRIHTLLERIDHKR